MNRSRILFAAVLLLAPGALRADCPDGARNTTEAERADFINGMNELKAAVPAAPAGWQLQAPAIPYVTAPATTCKGSKLFAAYSFTYTSTDQQKQLQERIHDRETRIAALSKLSPDEQKQFDDLRHQGSQLGYQSIAAQKAKNFDEAARLRAEANKFYAQSNEVRQAHQEKVAAQINALPNDYANMHPEVHVHLIITDKITGMSDAKTLVLSLGRDTAGRTVAAQIQGDPQNAKVIADLLATSGLRT